jgi:hypothetical protein
MNCWRSRLIVGVVFWLALDIHAEVTANLPNTPAGMLVFHGSAAAVDFFLLWSTPWLLSGRLCTDMEILCAVSIVGNALGWALYLAYAPPVFFNTFMWGLSYVQWGRLLLPDRHAADSIGFDVLRSAVGGRG